MSLFSQTFQDHIIEELEYRREFHAVQTTLMPHIRVTSLVEGYLEPWGRIDGFTLGITDVNNINSLGSYFNTPGRDGTVIGLTYPDRGKAVPVRIGGARNLPPPGVTNVSISTQSQGGFVFRAVVNVKFYGKEQYDFIYQTFLRPGNPIVIEYGHTRNPIEGKAPFTRPALDGSMAVEHGVIGAGPNNRDLNFFNQLGDRLDQYRDNFKKNIALPMTRNSGAIVGMVSNFRVRLNEQNEYEAEIELINSLEFLFTMSPEDTFLEYKTEGGNRSKSIQAGFGIARDGEWKPSSDSFFMQVVTDGTGIDYTNEMEVTDGSIGAPAGAPIVIPGGWAHRIVTAIRGKDFKPYTESIILPNEWIIDRPGYNREVGTVSTGTTEGEEWWINPIDKLQGDRSQIMDHSDTVYVSLFYFFNTLLGKIINTSYIDTKNLLDDVGLYDIVWDDQDIKYYKDLRSIDMKQVIINNESFYKDQHRVKEGILAGFGPDGEIRIGDWTGTTTATHMNYSQFFFDSRKYDYSWKFVDSDKPDYFTILPEWEAKELYSPTTPLGGIFINYAVVRNAFQRAISVAEAIQMILNAINTSTANILQLKMKFTPQPIQPFDSSLGSVFVDIIDETTGEVVSTVTSDDPSNLELDAGHTMEYANRFTNVGLSTQQLRITVYDQTQAIGSKSERAKLHNFFENVGTDMDRPGVSEAISYDFDFSLPNSVAAGVMASTFGPLEHQSAGGSSKEKAFIDYGYKIRSGTGSGPDNPPELAIKSMLDLGVAVNQAEIDVQETANQIRNVDLIGRPVASEVIGAADSAAIVAEYDMMVKDPAERADSARRLVYSPSRREQVGLVVPEGWTGNFTRTREWIAKNVPDERLQDFVNLELKIEAVERSPAGRLQHLNETDGRLRFTELSEEKLLKQIIGYQELVPPAMKAAAIRDGLYNIIPSSAKITIKLQGLDGFRFGDLFSVNNVLPSPYDESNVFMLTGYKHTIDTMGWYTEIGAILIASKPEKLIEVEKNMKEPT